MRTLRHPSGIGISSDVVVVVGVVAAVGVVVVDVDRRCQTTLKSIIESIVSPTERQSPFASRVSLDVCGCACRNGTAPTDRGRHSDVVRALRMRM